MHCDSDTDSTKDLASNIMLHIYFSFYAQHHAPLDYLAYVLVVYILPLLTSLMTKILSPPFVA